MVTSAKAQSERWGLRAFPSGRRARGDDRVVRVIGARVRTRKLFVWDSPLEQRTRFLESGCFNLVSHALRGQWANVRGIGVEDTQCESRYRIRGFDDEHGSRRKSC